jgi:hypothetical protein
LDGSFRAFELGKRRGSAQHHAKKPNEESQVQGLAFRLHSTTLLGPLALGNFDLLARDPGEADF